jgi:heptosyltransferase-3
METMNFKKVKKILVIKLRHIGDVLLTVPVFRALRENFPDAYIAALVNSGTEDVLSGNPLINEIFIFDRNIKKMNHPIRYIKELSFFKQIRMKGFDMTVDLTSGDRAALVSIISGARYRIAYSPKKEGLLAKKYLYTHLAKKHPGQHMVLQNLEVLRQFGIDTKQEQLDFFIPEEARIFVKRILEEKGLTKDDTVVHIHPTSRWLFKCWKDEYMAEVISWLIKQGLKVIVTSSPEKHELEKAQEILALVSSHQSLIDITGRTTIKQLAAIADASDLFIGVDSAPMHIAAAVGTPVIAIFGTGVKSWKPWCNRHVVLFKEAFSRKGINRKEYIKENLLRITPDDVMKEVQQFLLETNKSATKVY